MKHVILKKIDFFSRIESFHKTRYPLSPLYLMRVEKCKKNQKFMVVVYLQRLEIAEKY